VEKTLEREDIQAIVLVGHGHLHFQTSLFLRIPETNLPGLRGWLAALAEEVAVARVNKEKKPTRVVQVALTATGLRQLNFPAQSMSTFLGEFVDGMAEPVRARILGDEGSSAPEKWQFGGPSQEPVDLMLLLYAATGRDLEAFYQAHKERFEKVGIREVYRQDTLFMANGAEPFGFRDGIAQPAIEGVSRSRDASPEPEVKPGEFILGYENAYDRLSFTPTVGQADDPENLLAAHPDDSHLKDFGRNGTYLVLRKLRQDVAGFWKFFEEKSHPSPGAPTDEKKKEWLAAKCVGRWKSGAPLVLAPDHDDPALGPDVKRNNNFLYGDDPHGLKCPMASHIRRTNPRDSLITNTAEKSLVVSNRHRILRRGRPYVDPKPDGTVEEGIIFIALNSNIRRQFEFIQQTWMNNPKFNGLYDSKDPTAGNNYDPEYPDDKQEWYSMVIPKEPVRERVAGLPRFVHTMGGGYFFVPGVRALKFLASRCK
jgi:Dyp-type peroxidase family